MSSTRGFSAAWNAAGDRIICAVAGSAAVAGASRARADKLRAIPKQRSAGICSTRCGAATVAYCDAAADDAVTSCQTLHVCMHAFGDCFPWVGHHDGHRGPKVPTHPIRAAGAATRPWRFLPLSTNAGGDAAVGRYPNGQRQNAASTLLRWPAGWCSPSPTACRPVRRSWIDDGDSCDDGEIYYFNVLTTLE